MIVCQMLQTFTGKQPGVQTPEPLELPPKHRVSLRGGRTLVEAECVVELVLRGCEGDLLSVLVAVMHTWESSETLACPQLHFLLSLAETNGAERVHERNAPLTSLKIC